MLAGFVADFGANSRLRPLVAGLVALAFVGFCRSAPAAELHCKAPEENPDSRDVTRRRAPKQTAQAGRPIALRRLYFGP